MNSWKPPNLYVIHKELSNLFEQAYGFSEVTVLNVFKLHRSSDIAANIRTINRFTFLDQLEDIGNVRRLLHGTKCGNVFGILSRGFLLPNVEDLHKKYPNCEDWKLFVDLLHIWRYEDPLFRTVGPRNILCGSA